VEVGVLSSVFGGSFMVLTELLRLEMITELRILQRGKMRNEKMVAQKNSFVVCFLCGA